MGSTTRMTRHRSADAACPSVYRVGRSRSVSDSGSICPAVSTSGYPILNNALVVAHCVADATAATARRAWIAVSWPPFPTQCAQERTLSKSDSARKTESSHRQEAAVADVRRGAGYEYSAKRRVTSLDETPRGPFEGDAVLAGAKTGYGDWDNEMDRVRLLAHDMAMSVEGGAGSAREVGPRTA